MNKESNLTDLSVNTLEAREIRLVDSKGSTRATMGCSDQKSGRGWTVFQMLDDDGLPRIELQVSNEGCSIRLNTLGDAQGITVSVSDTAGNGLSINGHDGSPAIRMGISHPESNDPRGNHPELTMYDDTKQKTWSVER
jgi:hypothetical protein